MTPSVPTATPDLTDPLLRAILAATGAGVAVANQAGLCHASQGLADLVGGTVEDLAGRSLADLAHEDSRELVAERVRRGWAGQDLGTRVRIRLSTPAGPATWAELTLDRVDRDDTPLLVATLVDITDRLHAEHALLATEARHAQMFEGHRTGQFVASPEWKLIEGSASMASMLGVDTAEHLVGRAIVDLCADRAHLAWLLTTVRAAGRAGASELPLTRVNGEPITVALTLEGSFDELGVLTSMRGLMFEVTESAEARVRMVGTLRMEALGRLAGGVAHDLNNLLTVVSGHGERLADALGQDAALSHSVEAINQSARRAALLTQQLLAFSRHQVLRVRVLQLNQLVATARPLMSEALGDRIELVFDVPGEIPSVSVDPTQVTQVLVNLAQHAREVMPQGGTLMLRMDTLTVGVRRPRERPWVRQGSYVRIVVSDTGPGLDPVTQARMFEPFFSTRHLGRGGGLGLATVYGIVKQSNGYIWVDSVLGSGASFTVLFPALAADAGVTSGTPPVPLPSETILVVEDNEDVRLLISDELRRRGYRVLESPSGDRAVEACASFGARVHLLLTDVLLQSGTGPELANRLKADDPRLRVLYMSGLPSPAALDRYAATGVPLIQKPFTLRGLADKVRQVLDGGGEPS